MKAFEEQVFKRQRIDYNKLEPFGFIRDGEDYLFETSILDNSFGVEVKIESTGEVQLTVTDLDMEEDYTAFRVERLTGTFVGEVRSALLDILKDIKEQCCLPLNFQSEQANRLEEYIFTQFGESCDHPFEKIPDAAAFRYQVNQKWYALVMEVEKGKLDDQNGVFKEDELQEKVEILNIKVDPDQLSHYLKKAGCFPTYHMNKKQWMTITLDDRLADEDLFELVKQSRQLIVGNGPALSADYWIIPANPKYYDIENEFAENDVIKWTQKASMKPGDIVFVYVTAPTKAVRYACLVLESNIENNGYRKESSIKKLMKVQRLKTFTNEQYPMAVLKQYGVSNIRGPRRLPTELVEQLKKELEK